MTVWIQLINGSVGVVGESLLPEHGLAISNAGSIGIDSDHDSEFLVFNLA